MYLHWYLLSSHKLCSRRSPIKYDGLCFEKELQDCKLHLCLAMTGPVWGVCNVVTELTVTRQEWRYYTPRHHKNVFIKPRYCIFCIKDLQPARLFCPDQLFSIKVCLSFVCLMFDVVCMLTSQPVRLGHPPARHAIRVNQICNK